MHHVLLSTLSASDALGLLSLDGLAAIVMLYAAARVVRAPRERFSFGALSKIAWVVALFWFTWQQGDVFLPIGAVVALWHLRSLRRRHDTGRPGDLPFVTGTPVSTKDGQ